MMEWNQDSHLMEQIVDLLAVLQDNHVGVGKLLGENGRTFLRTLPGGRAFQAAYENLRFREEMPGGA